MGESFLLLSVSDRTHSEMLRSSRHELRQHHVLQTSVESGVSQLYARTQPVTDSRNGTAEPGLFQVMLRPDFCFSVELFLIT